MIRAAIFDLDGTLLNTLTDLAAAGNHTLGVLGFAPHPVAAYRQMVGNGIPTLVQRFLPAAAQGAASHALALTIFTRYYTAHKADTTAPYPGIVALLAQLRAHGVLLGVVSNKEDSLAKAVVAQYFPDTFDAVCGHVTGTLAKPHPHAVNAMRTAFGTAAEETLFLGDSNVDIETAQNAGLASCGVLWGFRTREELTAAGATFLAETAEDIFTLICCENGVEYVDGFAIPAPDAAQYVRLRTHCRNALLTFWHANAFTVQSIGRGIAAGETLVASDGLGAVCHRVPLTPETVLSLGEALAQDTLPQWLRSFA